MIKQFFKEITDEELIKKIWKTAKEKFTGRVLLITACMGCFYLTILGWKLNKLINLENTMEAFLFNLYGMET